MSCVSKPIRKIADRATALVALVLLAAGFALGAAQVNAPSEALSHERKQAMVKRVAAEFREKYVFGDAAAKMAELIEGKFARGEYEAINDLTAFTAKLQEDLRAVSNDRHVKVLPGLVPEFDDDPGLLRRENYGFSAVEVLPGNIGYLDFFQFYAVKDAGPTAIAAMNFLANADALIIDLRSNGGGYPELRSLNTG
jgi:hypothetical protein